MTRKLTLIALASLFALALTLLILGSSKAAGPKLGCKPYQLSVQTGQTFYFTVYVTDTVDLYAWQFDMSFTPAYLEFVKILPGYHLRRDGTAFYLVEPISTTGEIQLAAFTRLSEDVGIDGSGAIAHIFFKAKSQTSASGTTSASFNEPLLVDRNALDLSYGVNSSCKVNIRDSNPLLVQPSLEDLYLPIMVR